MIEYIRAEFIVSILGLSWLDTYSRKRALNKINSIIPRIGYGPWVSPHATYVLFWPVLLPPLPTTRRFSPPNKLNQLSFADHGRRGTRTILQG